MFGDAGFRHGRRATFVSAKVAKLMLAVAWPPASAGASSSGPLRGSPIPSALLRTGPAARKLAELVLRFVEGLSPGLPVFLSVRPWAGCQASVMGMRMMRGV